VENVCEGGGEEEAGKKVEILCYKSVTDNRLLIRALLLIFTKLHIVLRKITQEKLAQFK
jgi:hypothetical protein